MAQRFRANRRAALRGAGAALALPWLEALAPSTARAGMVSSPPTRICCWYVPNGMHLPAWFPERPGVLVDLPESLQPLSFARTYLNTFKGLTHNSAMTNGDDEGCGHGQGSASFLTGAQAYRSQDNVRVGISIDQLYAQYVGSETVLPSLELGCESPRSGNAFGYSGTYKTHISWRTANSPAPYEINPRIDFDRLFSQSESINASASIADRDFYRKSILDYVLEDASSVQKRVSVSDRRKLDQYLTSVREVERRIQNTNTQTDVSGRGYARPSGIPDDFDQHLRLMCDLMVLAFETDSTRAISFMLTKEATDRNYPWLGFTDGHHELSHHGNDAEKHSKLRAIDRYHVSLLAYMAEKMMTVEEANGSNLLQNSMILFGSGISDGDRHDHVNLPVLLLGKGGGTLRSGQHIDCRYETPMSNLLLSMLQQADVPIKRFGDSTAPLAELS